MKTEIDYKKELDNLKSEFMKLTKEKTLKESEYKKYFRLKKLYENKLLKG